VLQPSMGKQSNRNFTKNETWFRLQPSFVFAYFYSMLRAFLEKSHEDTRAASLLSIVTIGKIEAFNLGSTLLINVYKYEALECNAVYLLRQGALNLKLANFSVKHSWTHTRYRYI